MSSVPWQHVASSSQVLIWPTHFHDDNPSMATMMLAKHHSSRATLHFPSVAFPRFQFSHRRRVKSEKQNSFRKRSSVSPSVRQSGVMKDIRKTSFSHTPSRTCPSLLLSHGVHGKYLSYGTRDTLKRWCWTETNFRFYGFNDSSFVKQ